MAEIPFEPYTGQSKLRFWCQKVLPLVYDDSLSYYELLNKVVDYLNNTITDVSACEDNITALRDAFVQLQDYVNEVLDDFAPEVERVIDEMIDSGEFGEILADTVNGLIANEYSTTQGYAQFDYVIKDGKLYCATVSTSGEWDATKWRETTVGADMQLLNQRVYNLNAGQVAYNEAETYDNNTVGKKLKELDDFDDNLNAGQIAFNESTTYDNGTVGKKLKDLDDFDDNLNAGQVAYNSEGAYNNATVGKELQELKGSLNGILPLDTTPTSGSTKGITSGGVFAALPEFGWYPIALSDAESEGGTRKAVMSIYGNVVIITFLTASRKHAESDIILNVPTGYRPSVTYDFICGEGNYMLHLQLRQNGNLIVYLPSDNTNGGRAYGTIVFYTNHLT